MKAQLFFLLALAPLAGCAQPLHLQYDFGRAYTESMQIQANLDRPTVAQGNYPLSGTEAILIRANVEKQDATEKTGKLDSYAALFDPQWKGYVALEDNYTTAAQKTALYLKKAGLAQIGNPDDMTKEEFKTVIDFLIDQKKKGQFRVIWNSFEQAVNLIVNKEVYVIDCWEPMVFVAKSKGVDAVYADPKEGYLLWAMAAYLVKNPNRSAEQTTAAYQLLDFMLGGWYGATLTNLRGYMTNPQAVEYAAANPSEFPADQAKRVAEITDNVKRKFQAGGTWQNRWPTEVEFYEAEWSRFKAA